MSRFIALDIVVAGGRVYDGTGSPPRDVDVGIADGRVVVMGDLAAAEAPRRIDARGMLVAPGFIDIHTHSDFTLLVNRRAESAVRQGITSLVTGCCGHGCAPVGVRGPIENVIIGHRAEWGVQVDWRTFGEYLDCLRTGGVSVNIVPLVGHGALRLAVMGFAPRRPTDDEMRQMRRLLEDSLEAGAVGLSTGLEYAPGWHADLDELVDLATVVARHGGLYSSHIRNRAFTFVEAVDEALSVGRECGVPVQLSHLAPRPYAPPGILDAVLQRIDRARAEGLAVGTDTVIETWGPGPVASLLPPGFIEGPTPEVLDRLGSVAGRKSVQEYFSSSSNYLLQTAGLDGLIFTYVPRTPDVVGCSLAEVADHWEKPEHEVLCELLLREGQDFYNVFLRHVYATEDSVRALLACPYCVPMSDGASTAPYGPLADFVLNRSSYGWTARFLRQYAFDEQRMPIAEAIRRMTSLPAELLKLEGRGTLEEGSWADIVVLDAARLRDRTTASVPICYPSGIAFVLVNGRVTVDQQGHTGELAGELIGP